MADNVATAAQTLFGLSQATTENGMKAPLGLIHRKYKRRVAIHPVSSAPEKNWPREKFLKVADWLAGRGYDPLFLLPPSRRLEWASPEIPDITCLSSMIYESGFFIGTDSGPGHIASCLKIPHLIIGREKEQMDFWRPGWLAGRNRLPLPLIPTRSERNTGKSSLQQKT